MSLLDSALGALTGKIVSAAGSGEVGAALNHLLAENGGVEGLIGKFNQGGLGDIVSSWVSTGANHDVSSDQIHAVLGSSQVQAMAAKLGVDPAMASQLIAEYLPKIIDHLTPNGQVPSETDHASGLAALLPTLLAGFGSKTA